MADEQKADLRQSSLMSRSVFSPITALAAVGGAFIYIASRVSPAQYQPYFFALGGLMLLLCGVAASVLFLRSPESLRSETIGSHKADDEQVRKLQQMIKEAQSRLALLETRANFQSLSQENMISEVTEMVNVRLDQVVSDDVITRAASRLESNLNEFRGIERVRDAFASTQVRLENQVRRLARGGIYNLGVGGSISIAGIAVLGYFLIKDLGRQGTPVEFAIHYAPRLGLVVLIELLSFFFLNLYRSSLEEIKFYQNELTNIEQRLTAYEVARFTSDESSHIDIAGALLKTERNFTLAKGESTIELERARIAAGVSTATILGNIGAIAKDLASKK